MNDEERRQWVLNDEDLYRMQQRSGKGLYAFIRGNRAEIDSRAAAVLGRGPQ